MEIPKATNGVLEVNVETWSDLQLYTNYFSDTQSHFFRGQADSIWGLESTYDRYLKTLNDETFEDEEDRSNKDRYFYKIHLTNFKESLKGRGLKIGEMSNSELWALGQHYGLFTPLLNWTRFVFCIHK